MTEEEKGDPNLVDLEYLASLERERRANEEAWKRLDKKDQRKLDSAVRKAILETPETPKRDSLVGGLFRKKKTLVSLENLGKTLKQQPKLDKDVKEALGRFNKIRRGLLRKK